MEKAALSRRLVYKRNRLVTGLEPASAVVKLRQGWGRGSLQLSQVIKRMHKVSEDSGLGVQGSFWGGSASSQVEASALPSCGLMAKAVGQGTGFAHAKGAAAAEGPSVFVGWLNP